jgi:RHS repeat-associated protein
LAKTDEQGNYIREYIYGANHLLVGLKVDGAWYNYNRNYRGDIVAITDETGSLAAEYTYDSWGKPNTKKVIDDKLHDQPIRYASYYYDEDLKLYYLTARYYHPEHAVFLSIDSILDSDESIEMANGYSYVMNNPLTRIDPDGLQWHTDKMGGGVSYRVVKPSQISAKIRNLFNSNFRFNFIKGVNVAGVNVSRWHPGSFNSASQSAVEHYLKHRNQVGAKNLSQYIRKAEEFARNLKGAKKVQ